MTDFKKVEMLEQESANLQGKLDKDRIHVSNLPKFIGFKQFKKLLDKNLNGIHVKKVRQMGDYAYVSFDNQEDADKAISILNGLEIKKSVLTVKFAATEEVKVRSQDELIKEHIENPESVKPKTAKESVTPLADVPYEEQLLSKDAASLKLTDRLISQMKSTYIDVSQLKTQSILKKILRSPKIKEYRNKCEFTAGRTLTGEVCVGFVGGRFSQNKHYVIPIDDVSNITCHMKAIVHDFENWIKETDMPPFDEFHRTGVWKMLTVREFGLDVMLIITAFPQETEKEMELQKSACERFLAMSNFTEKNFRVTSIYWHSQTNSSENTAAVHIGGAPYIYESVLDCRFRISPSAFFQTNSQAAAVLYSTIGIACGFKEEIISNDSEDNENKSMPKKILLDICCGTGTIGICLMKKYMKTNQMVCVGIEMVQSAVEDAKKNAKDNGLSEAIIRHVAGKAEDVFRNMKYYLPTGYMLDECDVVGVLDPPRAGMHEKVILGCRSMHKMKQLVFVSCDPSAAMKNIVDLCRPTSKKYEGVPFTVSSVQPVDMFPQTSHFEWVVTLER